MAGEIRSVEEQAREEREQIKELGRPDKKKKAGAKKPSTSCSNVPGDRARRTTSTIATTGRSKIPNITPGEAQRTPSLAPSLSLWTSKGVLHGRRATNSVPGDEDPVGTHRQPMPLHRTEGKSENEKTKLPLRGE
jgi:hypothetical protein